MVAAEGESWLRLLAPFLFMILWSLLGLFFTSHDPRTSILFWEATAMLFAGFAIWRVARHRAVGWGMLALKQLAHWGAFLVAILVLHTRQVAAVFPDDALAPVVLLLVGLATFLDGLYVDWRFCVVGAVLIIGVVVLAVLSNAMLAIVGIAAVGAALLYALRRVGRAIASEPPAEQV